ncbi:MAG: hypothetical protein KBC06_00700 [Candidatus Pacebacteria bacterium]|nr:hypothetical protein [Candidatus Paceibacterota bacterium]
MKNFNKFKIAQAFLLVLVLVFTILPNFSNAQNALGLPCDPDEPDTWETSTGCYSNGTFGGGSGSTIFSSNQGSSGRVCATNVNDFGDLLCKLGSILNALIPLLVALGVVYFVWGVVQYMIGGGDEAKKEGRNRIIFGLIGLVVIFGMWGLVAIVVNTFGIANQAPDISNLSSGIVQASSGGLCSLVKNSNLQSLINYVICIISKSVIPLIFALALAMFIWGVVQYVINSDEEAKKEKGRQFMLWGIIALVVMVSVWGLVKIVGTTFGIEYAIPQLKSQ